MRTSQDTWSQFCANVGQLRRTGMLSRAQLDRLSQEAERLYDAGALSDDQVLLLLRALISPEEFARIDAIAYGIAKLLNTPINQFAAEAQCRAARGPNVY